MANHPLVWWHFSDLHWDVRSSTERRAFLSVLYNDLRLRIGELGIPDFVFFSGDIAYSGEEAQYSALEHEFLEPIRSLINSNDCLFFFVPGNHDVRRSLARMVNPELILSLNSSRSLNEFLDIDDYVEMVRKPFAGFDSFLKRMTPPVNQGILGWTSEVHIRNASILLIGLNSAWASSYHKTSEGLVDDERHLLLGQRQLLALAEASAKKDLTIVIAHHPLKWLNGFCDTQCRQILQRHADFVLFGHTHALHDLSQTLGAAGSTVYLPAPAIYDRVSTDTVEYARGYNIVRFDPETRKGSAHYFKYSDVYAAKFDPFVELFPTSGQNHFTIDLSNREDSQEAESRVQFESFSDVLMALPRVAALNRFLESVLEAPSLERHTSEYFETVVLNLVRESDLVDPELAYSFWESVVLSRALLFCDLRQLDSLRAKPYLYRQSVELLCSHLSEAAKREALDLELSVDEYGRLYALSFDSCSFNAGTLTSTSETYRRMFALPWALSRLLFYLDYPEVIPFALRSEGRIADLFAVEKPNQLAIMDYSFDAARGLLSIDVTKSPLFKVYAKAMALKEWVVVEGHREYALFRKAIGSLEWRGFGIEKDIYAERMKVFAEVTDSPLVDLVRGDYAVIADDIFGSEAFVVLPSNIPKSWKRGEAAGYTRRSVMATCPPRVLINPQHRLCKCLADFASKAFSDNATSKLRELKLLLDSLCDGVIENDRVTVARERWKTIQKDLRELLGGDLPEMVYDDSLVVRRH